MFQKIISLILTSALFLYLGCHDTVQLTRGEIMREKSYGDIDVITKDSNRYRFLEGHYQIKGDSLECSGKQITGEEGIRPFNGAIPLSNIYLIETQELNGVKTTLLVAGLAAATIGIIAAMAATSFKSSWGSSGGSGTGGRMSCPLVSTYDGTSYHLESETFSGAVFKGLERTSYDNLYHLRPVDGKYSLKIANESNETEYTNEFKLIVVDHPPSVNVIPDMRGDIHTIASPQQPLKCTDNNGNNILTQVSVKDNVFWQSDISTKDFQKENDLKDGIVLEFAKPADAKIAKLVVNGMNTRLGFFALEKIFQLKGEKKLSWYQQLERDTSQRNQFLRWIIREGMLHVKVWNGDTWQEQKAFVDVGPVIAKDQIVLLNVENIPGTMLKIKLECTTDLWKIDQVFVDYSSDVPVTVHELLLESAITDQGKEITPLLVQSDDKYYVASLGEHADVTFNDIPSRPELKRSYVLKTKGFYYQWIDASGRENAQALDRMLKEPMAGAKMFLPEWKKVKLVYSGIGN